MNKKVIAAIDFGTSGTTYAFAFLDSKDDIMHAKWPDTPDVKNSTEIILNEKLETIKFGSECKKYLADLSSSEEKFYHFTDIKMKLYTRENKENKIKATNDNISLEIDIVIFKILEFIKKAALSEIMSVRPGINESDIEWKVTVPAIWDNHSKMIMQKAAEKAGIFSCPLTFFALEPEAAACNYVNERASDKEAVKPGNKYIICDIGGGTVDISTHIRINEDNGKIHIEEVYPPCGGNYGSTYINKAFFEKVIKKIFGENAMNELDKIIKNPLLNKDTYLDYCILLEEIENFKINIKNYPNNSTQRERNEARRINCSLFESLIDSDISELINNYNKNCPEKWKITKHSRYKIYFPYQIMNDLTENIIVSNVVKHLKDILKNVPDIKSIIYAGSVSSNAFIINMISERIKECHNHYRSAYPSLAVVKGAVIFGFDPYTIKARISKYTIGIDVQEKWDENKHGKRTDLKFFDDLEKCYYCKDVFLPLIKSKQKIGIDEIVSANSNIHSPYGWAGFYKTIYGEVKFMDEKDHNSEKKLKNFGNLLVDVRDSFDKNDTKVIVQLYLGGTFIDVKIIYKDKENPGRFDFSEKE